MSEQTMRTPEEFAANYKVAPAGITGPVAIGNIVTVTDNQGRIRRLYNLTCKTKRNLEEGTPAYGRNAVYSEPADPTFEVGSPQNWKQKFHTGDYVMIQVSEDGYVQKLMRMPMQSLKAVNDTVNEANKQAAPAKTEVEEPKQKAVAEEQLVDQTAEVEEDPFDKE